MEFDHRQIATILPHEGWALGIDNAAYSLDAPDEITAKKILKEDDPYFFGHFPGNSILPGHWQIEFICLAAALLCKMKFPDATGYPTVVGFEGVSFKRIIRPGNMIEISAKFNEYLKVHGIPQYFLSGEIRLNGKIASKIKEIRGTLT